MDKIVTSASSSIATLTSARAGVVKVAGKTGEVLQVYASALCSAFDLVDSTGKVTSKWFELKGKLKAGVTAERAEFTSAMEDAGHKKNVHVYWQRVKEMSGYVTAGAAARAAQSVDDRTVSELKTILNRIFKAESESVECDKASEAKGLLIEAFETLGGDVDSIG